jgi:hypothetical protein
MPDQHIELPDGSVASFPDDMSDAEIKAVLRKRFPPPPPTSLEPGERLPRKNASVVFNEQFGRFVVYDNAGRPHGFRPTLDAAIDLADTIPPPPPSRVKPKSAPKPEKPIEPEVAEAQICADIESDIRRREAQERQERLADYRRRRHRNRGTLG